MKPAVIPSIIQYFFDQYDINKSEELAQAAQKWIPENDILMDKDAFNHLSSLGSNFNLLFLNQEISYDELSVLLISSGSPVLVFRITGTSKEPVVIHYTKKKFRVTTFHENNHFLPVTTSTDTLPENLDYSTTEENKIISNVITCVPLDNKTEITEPVSTKYKSITKLMQVLKQDKKAVLYIFLYSAFGGLISLSLPLGVQSLVGFISSGEVVTSAVVLIVFIILGILINGILSVMQLQMVEFIHQRLFVRTAFAFASRVPRIKTEAIFKYNPPELMNRFFDTLTLQKGLSTILIDFSGAILQTVFGILLLSFYHPSFLVLGTILIIVLVFILRVTGPKGIKTSLKESAFKYFVVNWLEEIARCLKTFKLAGNTSFATEKTDYFVSNYIKAREDHFKILKVQYYSFILFKTLITALLLIFGATLIVKQQINLGQFIAAEIVIILLMNSIEKIILKLDSVYDVLASVEKITDVTTLPVESYTGMDINVEKGSGLSILLNKVSYRYPDRLENSLHDVTLNINSGERVCIAGTNGSGKSTLINTMLGLHDGYEGQIAYNKLSLRNLNISTLRRHIGDYMAQEGIFEGTIYENITIGRKDVSRQDVIWAIEAAGLNQYIYSLPEGVNTKVIGGGIRIPDTVARKIIIARNIVLRPSLLILDDFLLGVEKSEKRRILNFLLSGQFGWTVIIISNDPMILKSVQRIIVMKNGTVEDTGTMKDLQQRNSTIKEIIQHSLPADSYEH